MKIAIVNDIFEETELLINILNNNSDFELIWTANDHKSAVSSFYSNKPDLVLIKLNIPFKDGASITKSLMEISPVAILILTPNIGNNQSKVFESMGYGALDVVNMPYKSYDTLIGSDELIKKIDIFKKLITYHKIAKPEIPIWDKRKSSSTKMVAIGSSTGGPKALSEIFRTIPENINATFIIIQHVDAQFANGLAEWLQNYCRLPISLAKSSESPIRGNVYIANTNDHLILNIHRKFEYSQFPIENNFRPSVDVFFESIRQNWFSNDIAVLLTGMGNDGAKELAELRKKGWFTIAQDESTSVVYGMPKAAKELNAAIEILPIHKIADKIIEHIY